jgi:hypothetical protein
MSVLPENLDLFKSLVETYRAKNDQAQDGKAPMVSPDKEVIVSLRTRPPLESEIQERGIFVPGVTVSKPDKMVVHVPAAKVPAQAFADWKSEILTVSGSGMDRPFRTGHTVLTLHLGPKMRIKRFFSNS